MTTTNSFHSVQREWLINRGHQCELFKYSPKGPVRFRLYTSLLKKLLRKFDVILCDFLTKPSLYLQRMAKKLPKQKKIIGRVHRDELFLPHIKELEKYDTIELFS
jgi:hypothetical protein